MYNYLDWLFIICRSYFDILVQLVCPVTHGPGEEQHGYSTVDRNYLYLYGSKALITFCEQINDHQGKKCCKIEPDVKGNGTFALCG